MAQFRAVIRGQRGEASRLGSIKSGLVAYVNGWNEGVTIRASVIDGKDVFAIYANGGSNGQPNDGYIGSVTRGHFYGADVKIPETL